MKSIIYKNSKKSGNEKCSDYPTHHFNFDKTCMTGGDALRCPLVSDAEESASRSASVADFRRKGAKTVSDANKMDELSASLREGG